MKAKKGFIYLCAFICIFIASSCEKETTVIDKSMVCFVETETDYFTRSCFQLNDGSYIIVGTGEPVAVMAKFSETGDFIWQKNLPGTLFGLKKGIPLPSGGFVLAGSDSSYVSTLGNGKTTIIKYDNDGNVVQTVTFNANPSGATIGHYLDFMLLENGNLAFCTGFRSANYIAYPRLFILNQNFATLFDQVYYASPGVPFTHLKQPSIQEGKDGSIYLSYQNDSPYANTTGLMKFNAGDYSFNFFKDSVGFGTGESPTSLAIDKNGNVCIASAKHISPSQPFFYYYFEEGLSIGNMVSVLRTDTAGSYIDRHDYSGFPSLGSLMKIVATSDGGFIMVGTANQNESFTIASNTSVFLIKTDSNLNKQWMKQFNATYAAVGYDVNETNDGGYVIGAFAKLFNKNFKMMIIKTDMNGN